MHNFYFFTFALSSPYTLAPPKVLSLDKRKIALSSCFDSRTFEIKISRFYNQTNKNINIFGFVLAYAYLCTRIINI